MISTDKQRNKELAERKIFIIPRGAWPVEVLLKYENGESSVYEVLFRFSECPEACEAVIEAMGFKWSREGEKFFLYEINSEGLCDFLSDPAGNAIPFDTRLQAFDFLLKEASE